MKVLILPAFYQQPGRPRLGPFFKEQALAIKSIGINVCIAYVEIRSLHEISFRGLSESRFQITCTEEGGILTLRQKSWNPITQTILGGKIWSWLTGRLVGHYIKHFGAPDLIHAHYSLWAGFAASKISDKFGIPYVLTEHSGQILQNKAEKFRPYISLAMRGAKKVVAVSQSLANKVATFNNNISPFVVPNVVDTTFFSMPSERPSKTKYVFLALGNLFPVKGFHLLLKAFSLSFKGDYGVALEIGGDGFLKSTLTNLAEELGIAKQVLFLGALSRHQVRAALWRAHSLVVSSLSETFGVVLIEALSTGLPVIATRCGGPEEIVLPEVGILVEPNDEEQLASALHKMRNDFRFDRYTLRQRVLDRYSYEVVSRELFNVYETVLNKN